MTLKREQTRFPSPQLLLNVGKAPSRPLYEVANQQATLASFLGNTSTVGEQPGSVH